MDDAIDATKLRALASQYKQPVLWISPANAASLPPVVGLSTSEKEFISQELVHDECASMLRGLPS